MKELSFDQMETVQGGGSLCSVAVGVGIGLLVAPMGFGGILVGAMLAVYADNAFC